MTRDHLFKLTRCIEHFPIEERWRWFADILVRCAPPEEVFDLITDGNQEIIQRLLHAPADLLVEDAEDPTTDMEAATATLREIISRGDAFALTVLFSIFRSRISRNLVESWSPVASRILESSPDADAWLRDNIATLVEPDGVPFLLNCKLERTKSVIFEYFEARGLHLLQRFLGRFPANAGPAATELLLLGLEVDSESVRKATISAIGRQANAFGLQALEDLLREFNFHGKYSVDEVEHLTHVMAEFPRGEGRAILESALAQKKSWGRATFRRNIRTAIQRALGKDGAK